EAGGGEVVVLDRLGAFGLEVLPETAAGCDVEDLQAATQSQERLAVAQCPARQHDLGGVACRVESAELRGAGTTIVGGIDVDATCNDDAVEPLVVRVERCGIPRDQRDYHRHATGLHHCVDVSLVHHPRRGQRLENATDGVESL